MFRSSSLPLSLLAISLLSACGDDDATGAGGAGGATSSSTTEATTSSTGIDVGTTQTTTQAGAGGGDGGASSTSTTSGLPTSSGTGGEGGTAPVCTQAREDALGAIDAVSEGQVLVLEEGDGEATLWVDASAGGIAEQENNPWVYVDLATLARVDVTDLGADADRSWDLAFKRPILRVNGDDGGPAGSGESALLSADFDDVDASDVAGAPFERERWFDDDCNLRVDGAGAIATTFDGWYLYEDMAVTPAPGTWLVRGGDGDEVFKIAILDYYADEDGSTGQAGGRYLLRVARLVP